MTTAKASFFIAFTIGLIVMIDGIRISWGKKKRDSGPFKVEIKLDPCSFESYDVNGDGEMTEREIMHTFKKHSKFGGKEDAWIKRLLKALDGENRDGIINKKEFKASASSVIRGC